MIITKTPFRMSFFGGGTDFKEFYEVNEGAVLSTTFDKYCYVTVRHLPPFFKHNNEIVYSKIEHTVDRESIAHPVVREAMKYLDMHNLHIAYDADLPARTGIGTSSSFAVGLLSALYALKGKYVDKRKLADDAIYLERILCNESGGLQDQIAISYGGFNKITFKKNEYSIDPVVMPEERKLILNKNLLMFYTGTTRNSSEIQDATRQVIKSKISELREMASLVNEAHKILTDRDSDLKEFGKLLDYTWNMKRKLSYSISTDDIEYYYNKAINAGAVGGKLLGAGGGGFLLFYVEPEAQKNVLKEIENLLHIPFRFEDKGTQILYYQAENY